MCRSPLPPAGADHGGGRAVRGARRGGLGAAPDRARASLLPKLPQR